jgi:hypothetical protein
VTQSLIAIALVVAGWAVLAKGLQRWRLTAPMVLVLAGLAVGFTVRGSLAPAFNAEVARSVAEIVLAVLLFVDATDVRGGFFGLDPRSAARVLFIALLIGRWLLPDLLWAVLTVIACTVVPHRFRFCALDSARWTHSGAGPESAQGRGGIQRWDHLAGVSVRTRCSLSSHPSCPTGSVSGSGAAHRRSSGSGHGGHLRFPLAVSRPAVAELLGSPRNTLDCVRAVGVQRPGRRRRRHDVGGGGAGGVGQHRDSRHFSPCCHTFLSAAGKPRGTCRIAPEWTLICAEEPVSCGRAATARSRSTPAVGDDWRRLSVRLASLPLAQ